MQQFTIGSEEHGCRLDRLLRKRLALLPLAGIYTLIRKGGVRVDGKKIKQDYRLREGEQLQIDVDQAEITSAASPRRFSA